MYSPKRIKKLNQSIINHIAAGEIIQRPYNALKELIENAIDAKSSKIEVLLKNGGITFLQVQDNGIGIHKDSFSIVCNRFTTNKLITLKDLIEIKTFGFRGEALASISNISHVTITSMTKKDIYAHKGTYVNGKLNQTIPLNVAGIKGTIVTIRDMFYNMILRKQVFNKAEEYRLCLNILNYYAIHFYKVSFFCRKVGNNKVDLQIVSQRFRKDTIQIIYGSKISKSLINFSFINNNFGVEAEGLASLPMKNLKKSHFILFINNRLIENKSIQKTIRGIYDKFLKQKCESFVYLSLKIKGENIDINIHPTKKNVHFLFEDEICNLLLITLKKILIKSTFSREFKMKKISINAKQKQVLIINKKRKAFNPEKLVRVNSKFQCDALEKYFGIEAKKNFFFP